MSLILIISSRRGKVNRSRKTKEILKERLSFYEIYVIIVAERRGVTMSLDYIKNNIALARNLRKNATPQENRLWYDFLSKYKIRFQRQKAIDNFIADFYCHKAKLIIEIDGSQHYTAEGKKKDEFRTEILEGYSLKVIRFTNTQIDKNFRGVCEYIDIVVKASVEDI